MPILMAVLGLIYMVIKRNWVLKQDAGDGKMKEIADYIYEGALAFLEGRIPSSYIFCDWGLCCPRSSSILCTNHSATSSYLHLLSGRYSLLWQATWV